MSFSEMSRENTADMISRQRAAMGNQGGTLSNTPYYIQHLERKIDSLEYKLNLILSELKKDKDA